MRLAITFLLSAFLLACPDGPPSPAVDGGSPAADGGSPAANDAGARADAGPAPVDAGQIADAGPASPKPIIGTWRMDPPGDSFHHIGFREDHVLVALSSIDPCAVGGSFPYSYVDGILTISPQGSPETVPYHWDGEDLLMPIEGEEVRLIATESQCHHPPEPIDIVGTWQVLTPEGREGGHIAFAGNDHLFDLADLGSCFVEEIVPYRLDDNVLRFDGSNEALQVAELEDGLAVGDMRLLPTDSTCHEQFAGNGDIPEVLIGTYQPEQQGMPGVSFLAFRSDNRLVGLSSLESCLEIQSSQVKVFGPALIIEMNAMGTRTANWRFEGENLVLDSVNGGMGALAPVESDCHLLP